MVDDSNKMKTEILACHCYKVDAEAFKELCRKKGLFHAEVLRNLILDWIKAQERGKGSEGNDWFNQ